LGVLTFIFFALLVASAVFSGCQKDKEDKVLPPEEEVEMVTVGMKAVGELRGAETPLTKSDAGKKPLWGIQVYVLSEEIQSMFPEFVAGTMMNPGLFTMAISDAQKVAHGVFDDLSKVTLTLNKKKRYCIKATYMPNGQNEIHYYGPTNDYWELPFNTFAWTKTPINQVIYSPNDYIIGIGYGMNTPAGDANNRIRTLLNEMDRYYGFVTEYIPVEGGAIEIDMKRTVFGLTFVGTKVDGFTFDKLVIKFYPAGATTLFPNTYTLNVDNSQPTSQLVIPLICIMDVRRSALENTYVETFKVSIGTEENPALLFYGDINVKRNTMHTYTFDMGSDEVDSSVNAIFSDGEMDNETKELE